MLDGSGIPSSNSDGPKVSDSVDSVGEFKIFFSNITSLSPHAKNYFSNDLDPDVKVLAINEIHKDDEIAVKNFFRGIGFKAEYNLPEPTTAQNHGGECVAVRSHFNSKPVNADVLISIETHFNANLRIAATIISLKGADVLLVTIYLWDSENFSPRNIIILQQLHMLATILNLPFVCIGDFNIHCEDFRNSEWPMFLKCDVVHPGEDTTLSTAMDRPIDFCLVSTKISMLFKCIRVITNVPWGPHYALLLTLFGTPKRIVGTTICVPKALPIDDFQSIWDTFDEHEQLAKIAAAWKRASRILHEQFKTTGVEILGKPSLALSNNQIFKMV